MFTLAGAIGSLFHQEMVSYAMVKLLFWVRVRVSFRVRVRVRNRTPMLATEPAKLHVSR